MPRHTVDSLMGFVFVLDDLTMREIPAILAALVVLSIVDPPHVQASTSTSWIASSLSLLLNFNLNDLMSGVKYPPKHRW